MSEEERSSGAQTWGNEEILRRYLLGLTSRAESDQVERAMLTDDLGPILNVVEDELVEDYVTDELSSFDRRHFEQRLLFRQELMQKVRVSAMLGGSATFLDRPDDAKYLPQGGSGVRLGSEQAADLNDAASLADEQGDPSPGDTQFASLDPSYVERLHREDPSTLEDFVRRFNALVEVKLDAVKPHARLQSSLAMKEVRQEVLARVFKVLSGGGSLLTPEQLGAFVNTVCNYVLLEYYRESYRFPQSQSIEKEGERELLSNIPDAASIERMKLEAQDILQELTPKDHLLLQMLLVEDRNKDEICRELGVDREYLRVLLHRARKAFRKANPDVSRKRA